LEPFSEKNVFGSEKIRKVYLDMRTYFAQRVFAKQLSNLIRDRVQSISQFQFESCPSRDMTLYQLIPYELQSSYFFEVIKSLFNGTLGQNKSDLRMLKSTLFQTLLIEKNFGLAYDLNNEIMNLYEQMGAGRLYQMVDEQEE